MKTAIFVYFRYMRTFTNKLDLFLVVSSANSLSLFITAV